MTEAIEELGRVDINDLARKCNEMEKKYCELVVFNGKRKKDALREAGSTAKEEYLSKMAYDMEQRLHVQAYLEVLRNIRSAEAQVEFREVLHNTRQAINSILVDPSGKNLGKLEPLLRLMAELGGFVKTTGTPTTAVQVNTIGGTSEVSSVEADVARLQRLTGKRD